LASQIFLFVLFHRWLLAGRPEGARTSGGRVGHPASLFPRGEGDRQRTKPLPGECPQQDSLFFSMKYLGDPKNNNLNIFKLKFKNLKIYIL
jgi:hypothetical protein